MSTLRVRPDPRGTAAESFPALVERLVSDVCQLLDHRLALATLEMRQHIESLARASMLLLAGGLFAMIGVLLLATAAALAMGRAIHSPAGGFVIVGAVVAIAGAIVIGAAKSRLARQSLAPAQTIADIRGDITWITQQAEKRSGSAKPSTT